MRPARRRTSTDVIRTVLLTAAAGLALAACDPAYSRPRLTPFPEADTAGVRGPIATATSEAVQALEAEGIPVARLDARDGWFRTEWLDTVDYQPVRGRPVGQGAVRIRGWVDPGGYGISRVTVEGVYRAVADPSLPDRELERPLPPGHPTIVRIRRALGRIAAP